MHVSSTYSPPTRVNTIEQEVRLLEKGKGVVDFSGHGILRLEGKDTLDFLHRISTNDLKDIRPGESSQTVLTTEKGRVIDSVVMHHQGDFLLAVTSTGTGKKVQQWLEKFIIMEDVKILNLSGKGILLVQMNSGGAADSLISSQQVSSFRGKYFGADATFYYRD